MILENSELDELTPESSEAELGCFYAQKSGMCADHWRRRKKLKSSPYYEGDK